MCHPESSSTISLNHITHLVTINATLDNYLLRHAQLVPYLKGHKMFKFVDGLQNPLPLMIFTLGANNSAPMLSPNLHWKQQD